MRTLFKIIFKNKIYQGLLVLTVIAMCFLTFATQMEILSMGLMTRKGPDVFELFAPVKEGKLQKQDTISKQNFENSWEQIDTQNKGYITQEDTSHYLAKWKNRDLVETAIQKVDSYLGISQTLSTLAIFLVFVAVFKAIALFCYRYINRFVAIRVSRDLRLAYFQHIQSLPLTFYHKHNIGSLSSRVVSDAAFIAEAINACLINYFETPFRTVTTLALCFLTSWKLSLIIFLGLPTIIFPIIFLARRVKRISKQVQKNQEKFASVLIDFLAGIQTVKVFAMEDFSLRKYQDQNTKMAKLEQRSARYDVSARPITHMIGMFFLATVLMYGLYVLKMSVSEVLLYCGFLYIFYEPIKKFAEENTHIQRGIAAAERMFEVMALKPQIHDLPDAVQLESFEKEIVFDNVWFKYEDEWILKGVSFTIRKGETVAIVGPTGSGKSTIVQLLPRLYDIQKGEIRIDGKPLYEYSQRSLRENIAFVPQKPFLFLDTIAENIAYGRPYSRSEVMDAARKAHADEFIQELPQGYDTELLEAGKNLSGGQQQRLAIARALVKKAPILVLDEATSSLDNISENHIKTAIQQLKGGMTQIIIAHRLTTIENADRIIYIEKGEKVAEGTPEELIRTTPTFARMWEMGLQPR